MPPIRILRLSLAWSDACWHGKVEWGYGTRYWSRCGLILEIRDLNLWTTSIRKPLSTRLMTYHSYPSKWSLKC